MVKEDKRGGFDMLEQGELLTLSNDKEYAVVSSIIYQGANYVYLLDTDTYKDYKLCKYEDENLIVVKDEDLLKTLITKFNLDLKNNVSNIFKDKE